MNPLHKVISLINNFINTASVRTIDTIKKLFFFVLLLLIIGSIVFGIKKGKESAAIPGTPLITNTNQAFDIQIKRERKNPYSSLLDEDRITEPVKREEKKIMLPSRENLEPDLDSSIIDNKGFDKIRKIPDIQSKDNLIEPNTSVIKENKSGINPIDNDDKLFNNNETNETKKTNTSPLYKSDKTHADDTTRDSKIYKKEKSQLQFKQNEGLIE